MPATLRRPGLVRSGFALFALGLVFTAVTVLPFFLGEHDRPLWLNAGCLLAPAGLALAVTGALRAGRADQRAALAATQRRGSPR
ncbi:MAG: hypothetical protein ABI047_03410 [Jatrophihabitantaceae bacterium]